MELEFNIIKLENNEEYVIVDAIQNENNKYLFLANKDNEEDICIRKVIENDGQEFLIKLDDEEEFEETLELFNIKHKKGEN